MQFSHPRSQVQLDNFVVPIMCCAQWSSSLVLWLVEGISNGRKGASSLVREGTESCLSWAGLSSFALLLAVLLYDHILGGRLFSARIDSLIS
ncbi:hypothetical protein M758_UG095200 [Ceratodon purpureus]|nr:hypothetical protein M758_UG095200 [Ceratodon purpureus]